LERIQARPLLSLNPQETDPAGTLAKADILAKADMQQLKTGD
jgi:hypothetical protein